MSINVGDTLPEGKFIRMAESGPETVTVSSLTSGRKVAIFAVPGAFTPTCHSAHMPSFIRVKDALAMAGIEDIICIAVNDPFVTKVWGEATGATEAGIQVLSDADGSFTKAIGLDFSAPPVGLLGRSRRYSMVADNGVVSILNLDEPGVCETSAGEALLDQVKTE